MASLLPAAISLGTVALCAWLLTSPRRSPPDYGTQRLAAANALAGTVGIQSVHFAEELFTGFHQRFPALFGLPEMPLAAFVAFNLIWIGLWIASVWGVRSGRPLAFFAGAFLALAGMLNGIAHPLMAFSVQAYFPGLMTSPFIGAAGIWLWLRLRRATVRKA